SSQKEIIEESTKTIVQQVDTQRTLVNEFSQFARMPKAILKPDNLNSLVKETISLFEQSNSEIDFKLLVEDSIPLVAIDREQINRILINLIDNSIASINLAKENGYVSRGIITTTTSYDRDLSIVTFSV